MNVLLTSAGRRVALLRSFRRAVGGAGRVIAADRDPTAPTLHVADANVLLPPVTSPEYVEAVRDAALRHEVRLIVPLIDPELPILADKADEFRRLGIDVMISSAEAVRIAVDKLRTSQFFATIGVPAPRTIPGGDLTPEWADYPVVLKPRMGSGSEGVVMASSWGEAQFYIRQRPDLVAQQRVCGTEVTLDVLGDGRGNVISLVPRKRLKVRGGEVERAVTVDDEPFRYPVERICAFLKPYGAINMQCIVGTQGPVFTEINARFGGGYPLADMAGAAFPELILALVTGNRRQDILPYKRGLLMSRYDDAVFTSVADLPGGEQLLAL